LVIVEVITLAAAQTTITVSETITPVASACASDLAQSTTVLTGDRRSVSNGVSGCFA
jgi:hypothetical protein